MKHKKYILFDFDGTLFNSQIGIKKAIQYALSFEGIDEQDQAILQSFIGPSLHYSFEKHYGFNKDKLDDLVKNLRVYYNETGYLETEIYDGIPLLLEQLLSKNKVLAIATAKPTHFTEKILAHFALRSFFTSVQGSLLKGDVFPKENIIRAVLHDLNLYDSEEAVMVGDTIYDIKGAQYHQMQSIGVKYGYGKEKDLKAAGATKIVETVAELQGVLVV
jgi:phosphoglycolate phosphatase